MHPNIPETASTNQQKSKHNNLATRQQQNNAACQTNAQTLRLTNTLSRHLDTYICSICRVHLFNVSKPVTMNRNRDADPSHLFGNEKRRLRCKPVPDWERAKLPRTQNQDSARLSSTHLITRSSTMQIFPHHLLRLSTSPPPSE